MSQAIRVAGVIGAGVMGSAIAAHLAGAGIAVELLDIVPPAGASPGTASRNAFAENGLKRALEAKPAPFFDPDIARLVTPGNLEDHLERLRRCDFVVEAVTESLDIKQKLFAKIAPYLAPHAVLASNTSGLSVKQMSEALPKELRSRFLVTHFFNPVRYMRLLEVVPCPDTDPAVLAAMVAFGEMLGKVVVPAKDTTNFIGNRIGVYSLLLSAHEMLKSGIGIEEVDAVGGKPLGRPKSAVFGTADLVGLDTLLHVARNCFESLTDDPERAVFAVPESITKLVAAGGLGRKTGAGFYKKVGDEIWVLDLATQLYRAPQAVQHPALAAKGSLAQRLAVLLQGQDAISLFAWKTLSKTLAYSASLVGEIADQIPDIDRAMKFGFSWELGPFEVWDALGVQQTVERMKQDGTSVPAWVDSMLATGRKSFYGAAGSDVAGPPTPDVYDVPAQAPRAILRSRKELTVARAKELPGKIVAENKGCSLVDLGDGVLGIELHTKMNTIDGDVIEMVDRGVALAEKDFEAIVVGNDAEHFSAGANLMMIMGAAMEGKWDRVDQIIAGLQNALQRLKYAAVPVVSAPTQYTLGGGAELAMAADASQAHAETYMGLVEVGVGLVPAGGGCLRLVERYTAHLVDIEGVDLLPHVAQASLQIALAKTSTSAEEAKRFRYLRATDGISLNRDFLLYEAKQRAIGLAAAGYRAPRPLQLKAAGYDAARTIGLRIWGMQEGRFASAHDALIANKIAHILCGGTVAAGTLLSEQHYLDLEREAFLQLCGEQKTQERVQHMLKTGKPLRN